MSDRMTTMLALVARPHWTDESTFQLVRLLAAYALTGSGVLPPLILKYPQFNRTLDPDRFLFDDYVRTYYLFSLSPVLSRIVYLDLIEHLDDSDDIDRVIMDFNMQHHKTQG